MSFRSFCFEQFFLDRSVAKGGGGGGGAEINFGGHEKFICVNSRGARGMKNSFQSGSNEEGEDQKKKVFVPKVL